MRARFIASALSASLMLIRCDPLAGQTPPVKKLIEFGWDRPSPSFIAAHAARMDSSLFDGVVLQFSTGSTVLRLRGVDTTALNRDAALLHGVTLRHLVHNFALMNLTPDSGWDWFDDRVWRVSESNIWRMARAAKAAGLRGIALDYEPYGRNPWDYRELPQGPGRSFEDYAAKVQARGRRLMTALQGGFPDLAILALFQMSYLDRIAALANPLSRQGALARTDYGLLAPFVAGMLEAASGKTCISDGNERAYWYADSTAFSMGAQAIRTGALGLLPAELQPAYQQRVQVGQAVFADYLLGIYQRAGDSVAARVAPGDRLKWLEYNVYHALRNADEYVWVYSQKMNWWKQDSLPPGLAEAVERAARAANTGAALGFGPPDFIR